MPRGYALRCARRVRCPRRAARRPVRRAAAERLRAGRRRAPRRRRGARPAARAPVARARPRRRGRRRRRGGAPRTARSPPTSASGPRACSVGDVRLRPRARPRRDLRRTRARCPTCGPGTLDDDLHRRDVTVNAIALGLDGTLAAVDGALDDLRGRRPARAARRVLRRRPHARLARGALRGAAGLRRRRRTRARWPPRADPATVSGDRLGAELRLALDEPDPLAALQAVAELNPAYLPEGFDPRPRALAAALDAAARRRPPRPAHPGRLHRRDGRPRAAGAGSTTWASSPPDRDRVAAASRYSTGAPLRAARTNAEIARAARGAPVEAVALAGRRERPPLAGRPARRAPGDQRRRPARRRRPAGPRDRRAAAARAGPQARRRDRRARAGAGRRRSRRTADRLAADERQRAAVGRRARPLRGLLPLGHRSAQRHRACGSATRCARAG